MDALKDKTKMKKLVFLFFCLLFAHTVVAQTTDEWTMPDELACVTLDSKLYKKIVSDFSKKDSVQMVYHYDKSKWRNMSMQEYSDVFAAEEMGYDDKNYMKRLLLNFEEIMQQESGLKVGNSAPFIVHVVLNSVGMNAAIDAKALIVYKDTIPFAFINLDVESGRWNKFSVLWKENTVKMANILKRKLSLFRKELWWGEKMEGILIRNNVVELR